MRVLLAWGRLGSMVVLGVAVLSVAVLVLPTLTALGARRRGAGLPLAALSGLCFPVTWTWWYVRDVHPYDRSRSTGAKTESPWFSPR